MAKNTGDTKFRKVDVDQYTDSAFQDELVEDVKPSSLNESEVNKFILSGNPSAALFTILQNAPVNSKDQGEKDTAFKLVLRILSLFKSQNIDDFLSTLDQDKLDLLLKYVYRAFEHPQEVSSTIVLTWHEKIFAYGKLGSIVRVLTDRKRI